MTEAAVAVERAKLLLETLVEDLVATLAQNTNSLALFTRRITAASAGEGSTGGHQCCGRMFPTSRLASNITRSVANHAPASPFNYYSTGALELHPRVLSSPRILRLW